MTALRSGLPRYLKNHNRQILIDIQCLGQGNEGEKDSSTMCLCPRELKKAFNFNTVHYEHYEIIVSNHWQLNLSHGMFVKLAVNITKQLTIEDMSQQKIQRGGGDLIKT